MLCTTCGTVGQHKKKAKGSIWIEIIGWLCYIIPGLIYSIWRLTTKRLVCTACGGESLIPEDSVMGKKIIGEVKVDDQPKNI